ncbi:acetyl-CoA hydrolase/transferase family protein [Chloroflexota bacterium]
MKDWQEEYRSKIITPDEAAAMVKSGDRVTFTMGREAHTLGLALAVRKEELKGVKVFTPAAGYDFGWYDPGWEDSFEITTSIGTALIQPMLDERRCDFNPTGLIPQEDCENLWDADVVFTEVSLPDDKGFCSFGLSLWNKRRHIEIAKLVIAEVNDKLIRTHGDNYVHISEIDYFVMHEPSGIPLGTGSLTGKEVKEPEPYLKDIASNVAKLVRDRDTLQIGVGRTTEPLAALGILDDKKDLGYHSETTPPGIISLVRKGVITGKYKGLHPGKVVVTSVGGGSRQEIEWVNNNPIFLLVDVAYLEDVGIIAKHDNFVAINNALQTDLTGQIAAETLGNRMISLAGGQIPFAIGARFSKGGRFITVLPSTALGGSVSRIVPQLEPGTVVTIQRNLTDYVVTEYGIAHLRGKSVRNRAQALIDIAHPKFRDELEKAARKLFWP